MLRIAGPIASTLARRDTGFAPPHPYASSVISTILGEKKFRQLAEAAMTGVHTSYTRTFAVDSL
jgi:hypothetical protein